tara:strand:+ start:1558 stop:2274 length:717 start_codon:yes stop_codon:yes gene_type:complete
MTKPYKNSKEYYDLQAEDLFLETDVKFYHKGFVGDTDEEFSDYIIEEAGITETSKVVEFGCGSGYFTNVLNNLCEVEGISNSPINIDVCKKLYPDCNFIVADMEDHEAQDKSHCIALESFNYSNPEKTFKNAHKILRTGGIFYMKEWMGVEDDNEKILENKQYLRDIFCYNPYKTSDMLGLAEMCGFEIVGIRNLTDKVNMDSYMNAVKYHNEYVLNSSFPHIGVAFVQPMQLKFKKI